MINEAKRIVAAALKAAAGTNGGRDWDSVIVAAGVDSETAERMLLKVDEFTPSPLSPFVEVCFTGPDGKQAWYFTDEFWPEAQQRMASMKAQPQAPQHSVPAKPKSVLAGRKSILETHKALSETHKPLKLLSESVKPLPKARG